MDGQLAGLLLIGSVALIAAAIGIGFGIVIARRAQPLVDRANSDDSDSKTEHLDA